MSSPAHGDYLPKANKNQIKKFSHYLAPGEKMQYLTGLSPLHLFRFGVLRYLVPGIPVIILTVIFMQIAGVHLVFGLLLGYFLAFIVSLIMVYFEAAGTQYILTNKRLIMQLGYFNVSLTSAVYDKITHVEVRQGFVERAIYKFGKVIIHTAGSKNKEIVLDNIAHPLKFKNLMEKLIDEAGQKEKKAKNEKYKPKWRQTRGFKKIL